MTKGWLFSHGMEKPPTFCHLASDSPELKLGLLLNWGEPTLSPVPWPWGLGTTAAWQPWPLSACRSRLIYWPTPFNDQTWRETHRLRKLSLASTSYDDYKVYSTDLRWLLIAAPVDYVHLSNNESENHQLSPFFEVAYWLVDRSTRRGS